MYRLPVVLMLVSIIIISCAGQPQFKGRDFSYGPAPDFRLPDQNGQIISLSDQRGKVVVLTFMYTNCRDTCPLIAAKFSTAYDQLGDAAKRVSFIVISSDPEGDTLVAVQRFTKTFRLDGKWHYLIDTRPQLAVVWKAYFVAAQKVGTPEPSNGIPQEVIHSTSVLLLDKQGLEQLKHDSDFEPADLVYDIRALLNE